MKSMRFIKPWRVHKIVFLHIYLKIMMSLPQSKYNQSFVFLSFSLYESKGTMTIIKTAKKKQGERSSLLPFCPLSMSYLILITVASLQSPSRLTSGFAFLGENTSFFLFSHFLNPHTALWWLNLHYILNMHWIIPDLQVVYSCWES